MSIRLSNSPLRSCGPVRPTAGLCLALVLASACATNDSVASSEVPNEGDVEHDSLLDPATGNDGSEPSDEPDASVDDDTTDSDPESDDTPPEQNTGDGDGDGDTTTPPSTTPPKPGGSTGTTVSDTMYVKGRQLYTACGEKIVLRGVNHPTLYIDRAGAALPEIAKTRANAVRLFWYANNGVSITEADAVIARTIANGMVPILEMHDATGPSNWSQLDSIVDYWTSPEAVALIKKYQQHMIVNIANEAGPEAGSDHAGFESAYREAVTALRSAGIKVPLMIDASGWGRDYESLFDAGPDLIEHDPEHNLMLSWHAYDVMSRQQIAAVYERAVDGDLPLLVGEFANRSPVGTCGPQLAYLDLIAEAQAREIGWLAWSWGDNDPSTAWNGDCAEFDMTSTFAFDSLSGWGEEVSVTDANSLSKKSVRPASLTSGRCQ
jgi:mannan endo-1,4-beta-mannosidase